MGCNEDEKSKSPKDTLGLILNLHRKFQLPGLIWRGVTRGTNTKYKKTYSKKHIFGSVRKCNKNEKSKLSKYTSMAATKFTYQISTS